MLRNRAAYAFFDNRLSPVQGLINSYREKWRLPPHLYANDSYSTLAQICHQPAEFEFPREELPKHFHFVGPYQGDVGRVPAQFPYERLTGQPLIYASMGTLQNRLSWVFGNIAEACAELDHQLVISLGDNASTGFTSRLPGSPLVVGYAPQLELLQRASLTITHAGMNTTLESLRAGVPMVAIPVTNDQPGVASRIARCGVGEFLPVIRLAPSSLKHAVKKVLRSDSYKRNALRLQEAISSSGGVKLAGDIIEQAISTGKPVLADSAFGR
jgi:MGT family glycosyltransferase